MYRYVTGLLLVAVAGSAWGQTLGFDLSGGNTFTAGQVFTLTLDANNFTQGLTGGGVDLQFNSAVLSLQSVAVNTAFDVAPSSGGLPAVQINNTTGTATGVDFFAALNPSLTGNTIGIATFQFVADAAGAGNLILSADSSFGPFYDANLNQINPGTDFNFATSSVSVTSVVAPVPEPPTFWLLAGAALAGLSIRRWIANKSVTTFA
jgi:PEP-CTERM motif-containing protein